ncbi:MAG: SRPBCC domain-containing protein [Pseudomonadota bacterium]
MSDSRYGWVEHLDDGRHRVMFERLLPYSQQAVWEAITEADQLANWMPGIQFEPRLGGEFNIWFGGECEGPSHVSGKVEAFEPPNLLVLGTICWQLEAVEEGCRLTFSDILHYDHRSRTDFANSVLGGWHMYVDTLEWHLNGQNGISPQEEPEVNYAAIDVPGRT